MSIFEILLESGIVIALAIFIALGGLDALFK